MRNLSSALSASCLGALTGLLLINFVFAVEKIDINTAPLEDLVKIIHIGETRARELISLRPFSSLDELIEIKGISETRVEDIKEQGLAWVKNEEKETPKLITYSGGVVINELLPSPEGLDAEEEWIEIFNQNAFEVDLSEWWITDVIGTTKTYDFPEKITIKAREFLVLSRLVTKITLNNSGDELKLVQPDGNIIDTVSYGKAPRGESYNRTESGWAWSRVLTPSSANIIPFSAPEPEETESSESVMETIPKKEAKEESRKELAVISEQIPKESAGFPSRAALGIAFFSGIMILLLKSQTKKVYNKTV
jgi:hypothetical protein